MSGDDSTSGRGRRSRRCSVRRLRGSSRRRRGMSRSAGKMRGGAAAADDNGFGEIPSGRVVRHRQCPVVAGQSLRLKGSRPGFHTAVLPYLALRGPTYRKNSHANHTWRQHSHQTACFQGPELPSPWVRFPSPAPFSVAWRRPVLPQDATSPIAQFPQPRYGCNRSIGRACW